MRVRISFPFAALAILVLTAGMASAQPQSAAVIEYASSDDVIVIRQGRSLTIADPFGFELQEGDNVQTGRSTLLEIRLTQGNAVFKLAENTTFVLTKAVSGETTLSLIYGRLRAKVDKLGGKDAFTLAGASAVAGVRGTDFGMDVIASRSSGLSFPLTQVYCFEGEVLVTALVNTLASSKERLESIPKGFVISSGEMVTVQRIEDIIDANKSSILPAIELFWADKGFSGASIPQEPPATAAAAAAVAPTASAPDDADGGLSEQERLNVYYAAYAEGFEAAKRDLAVTGGGMSAEEAKQYAGAVRLQKGTFLTAGLIASAGLGLNLAGLYFTSAGDADTADSLSKGGLVLTGLSIPFFAIALAVGP
jgi:hypothetical protein